MFNMDANSSAIAYASRRLDNSGARYSTTRCEMLELVKFLQRFLRYLMGRCFRVRTDYRALHLLRSFREPEGHVARWRERIKEFSFTCECRSGNQEINVDVLSQIPQPSDIINAIASTALEIAWSSLQVADQDLQPIYQRHMHESNKPSMREPKDQAVTNCRICRKWSSFKLCVNTLFLVNKSRHASLIFPRVKIVTRVAV